MSVDMLPAQFEKQGLPIINSMVTREGIGPRYFRTCRAIPLGNKKKINTAGLETLKMSASSQPSPSELGAIKKYWGQTPVHVVVLRMEEVYAIETQSKGTILVSQIHPLAWWSEEGQHGKWSVEKAHASEEKLVAAVKNNPHIVLYGNKDQVPTIEKGEGYDLLYRMDIVATNAFTLKQAVERAGLVYHRISDNKFNPIAWETVDQIVALLREIPAADAVHFHCKKGESRTTVTMTMFDMMRNADKASAHDIIYRQGPKGLGGEDITIAKTGKGAIGTHPRWEPTLMNFHQYCLENKANNFVVPFSQWCVSKGIPPESKMTFLAYTHKLSLKSRIPEVSSEEMKQESQLVFNNLDESKLWPNNFRTTQDAFLQTSTFNTLGLQDCLAGGCSQPTALGAEAIFKHLSEFFALTSLICVDLRPYPHWFVFTDKEGHDVNLQGKHAGEVLAEEQKQAKLIAAGKSLRLHLGKEINSDTTALANYRVTLAPTKVMTEKEVIEKMGIRYARLPLSSPASLHDKQVDAIVQLRRENPNAMVIYHCKTGKTRTTLAMCMDDMMQNADKVSLGDILQRQQALGGVDLTTKPAWMGFLIRFYTYCQYQIPRGYKQPWSEWNSSKRPV